MIHSSASSCLYISEETASFNTSLLKFTLQLKIKQWLLVSFELWTFSRQTINLSIKDTLTKQELWNVTVVYSNIIFITCLRISKIEMWKIASVSPPLFRVYFYQTSFFTRMIFLLLVFFAEGFCQTSTNSVVGFFEPEPPYECP